MRSKIGEQVETIAGLRHTKNRLEYEIDNMCIHAQMRTEMTHQLGHGTETAPASSGALTESPAACAMLTSEQHSLLVAMHWVKAMWHETR